MKCSLTLRECNEKVWMTAHSMFAVVIIALEIIAALGILFIGSAGIIHGFKYITALVLSA